MIGICPRRAQTRRTIPEDTMVGEVTPHLHPYQEAPARIRSLRGREDADRVPEDDEVAR